MVGGFTKVDLMAKPSRFFVKEQELVAGVTEGDWLSSVPKFTEGKVKELGSSKQLADTLSRFVSHLTFGDRKPWSALCTEAYTQLLKTFYSAEAIKLICFLTGAACTGTKEESILALARLKVRIPSSAAVVNIYNRCQCVLGGGDDPGPALGPDGDREVAGRVHGHGTAEESEEPEDVGLAEFFSPKQFKAMMAMMQVVSRQPAAGQAAVLTQEGALKSASNPRQRILLECQQKIDRRQCGFDVCLLANDHLVNMSTYAAKSSSTNRITLPSGHFIDSGMSREPAAEKAFDVKSIGQGLDRFVEMHSKSVVAEVRDRVPDLLEWVRVVFTYSPDVLKTCRYVKEFMGEYGDQDGWVDLFNSDSAMRERVFLMPTINPNSKRAATTPPNGDGRATKASKTRKETRANGGAQKKSPTPGQHGGRFKWSHGDALPKYCDSRTKAGAKCTHDPRCKFDHESPVFPGSFQTAAELVSAGSWDQAKCDAALRERGGR